MDVMDAVDGSRYSQWSKFLFEEKSDDELRDIAIENNSAAAGGGPFIANYNPFKPSTRKASSMHPHRRDRSRNISGFGLARERVANLGGFDTR